MTTEEFIKKIAYEAGEKILTFYGNVEILRAKANAADIVTEADMASNELICNAIKAEYPDHGIVSEEGDDYKPESEYQWYIDPLDGTKNFATYTPLFGINIALAHKGEVTHAAIYLPCLKDYISAEKGKGAWLNGKQVFCSDKKEWEATYGLSTNRYRAPAVGILKKISELSNESGWNNAVASSAVAGLWVSSGKRDWYIGPGSNAWDYMATSLIAKEGGAIVTNFAGTEYKPGDKGLVVTNEFLFPQLIEMVKAEYGK